MGHTSYNFVDMAQRLFDMHGILPVACSGKIPLGGDNWNMAPLSERLLQLMAPGCSGLGLQFGLIFHPTLGPVTVRGIDCDEVDPTKRDIWGAFVCKSFPTLKWRWGSGPAAIVFVRGELRREKYGTTAGGKAAIQLLSPGKMSVWWGYHATANGNQYWHPGGDLLEHTPPVIDAAELDHVLLQACQAAGIPTESTQHDVSKATPLSSDDIARLTPGYLDQLAYEARLAVSQVNGMPDGTGQGEVLHQLGLKVGALAKASGGAPQLDLAARSQADYVEIAPYPGLEGFGALCEAAYLSLPGGLNAGRQRNFARGVAMSKGLQQVGAARREDVAQQLRIGATPQGRNAPGQTADALAAENLPSLRYLIGRYLAMGGCIVLAGKPKIGKGWIILDMALAVAEGTEFWGEEAEQGEVLCYMLEDNKRRLKDRLKIMRPNGLQNGAGQRLRFRYSADGPFAINSDGSGSLLEDIKKHLIDFPNIKLLIIDVLQRVRGLIDKSDNAYQIDYKIIAAVQKLCSDYNVTAIVVHHTKKGKVDEAIDSINGSFGVIGAADGGMVIAKDDAVVRVESMMRDIPDFDLQLIKDEDSPVWKPIELQSKGGGMASGSQPYAIASTLLAAGCELTPSDIAHRTKLNENSVKVHVRRMADDGRITQVARGLYMAPGVARRDRLEGVKDTLRAANLQPVTADLEAKLTGTKGAPEHARFAIPTREAIAVIEERFANGKHALEQLRHRGVVVFNTDTTWLLGDEWGPRPQVMQSLPWEAPSLQPKLPWEK